MKIHKEPKTFVKKAIYIIRLAVLKCPKSLRLNINMYKDWYVIHFKKYIKIEPEALLSNLLNQCDISYFKLCQWISQNYICILIRRWSISKVTNTENIILHSIIIFHFKSIFPFVVFDRCPRFSVVWSLVVFQRVWFIQISICRLEAVNPFSMVTEFRKKELIGHCYRFLY